VLIAEKHAYVTEVNGNTNACSVQFDEADLFGLHALTVHAYQTAKLQASIYIGAIKADMFLLYKTAED
jgi:hypothetical protein